MSEAAKWSGYYKIITPKNATVKMVDSQEMSDAGAYNNFTWYSRLIQGSASRMTRYREYTLMDGDIEVSRALDTIAEEMTGNSPKSKEPLLIDILSEDEDNVDSTAVLTLKAALRRWGQIHKFQNRLYTIARMTIKYGDVFFRKQKTAYDNWLYLNPNNIIAAIVDAEDATKIVAWQIKSDVNKPRTGGYGLAIGTKEATLHETEIVAAADIVRFSLNDDMSDTQPFGESVLRPVYRSHKQKELLEDAIIIYRVQRAPERRVFYIDVGKMPPQRVKQYLEGIKNEIKQKKVPTMNGGQSEIDSVYNPQSMCLDLNVKIPLLDGRSETLQTLINEYEDGKDNWAYSIDPNTGNYVPGIISWAGITRKQTETVILTLDNGNKFTCTPDHHFYVQGNGYEKIKAKDLTPDHSLWPFYTKHTANNKLTIYNPASSSWKSIDQLNQNVIEGHTPDDLRRYVVNIEVGPIMDTGTLTIDKEHEYHDYHNFVIQTSTDNNELHGIVTANSEDFFFACLSMNTEVFLLDGRTLTIDELRVEHEAGKENWTYSVDQTTGKLISGKIDWAGFTRRNAELVRVHLDNGKFIDCTPDHKFVLKCGEEVEAQDLTSGTSLMPIYKKKCKTNKKQKQELYERIVDNETGKWTFTHLAVCPKLEDTGTVIHHCDYNPSNNSPTNLVELTHEDHWKYHHSPNGHTLGRMWRDNRDVMLAGIHHYHANRTEEQTNTIIERNRKNGSNTWMLHEQEKRQHLDAGRQTTRNKFDTYDEYCQYMAKMGTLQWTDEKRSIKSKQTIEFNKKTKSYVVDDKLFALFVSEFNGGNNTMPTIKQALRSSNPFIAHFNNINSNNQNIKNNKPVKFSDTFVYKIVNHGGYGTFKEFKENYAFNHNVTKVEKLNHTEDTGCLHVVDQNGNHNFALAAGVYVKNSRPDGRGSRVDTLPGGAGLGELSDLEYFRNKVWRGLKIPVSYMTDQGDGGQLFNDGKVGLAYIEELRFTLYIERLQGYMEETLDAEFKLFLRQNKINVDESMYRVILPEPSNFGKYKQLELDGALLNTYSTADGIKHLSPRFAMKRFLQMTDEEIITNERMKREEIGLDPDGGDDDLQTLYGDTDGGDAGLGGGLGGGFGGSDLGLGATTPPTDTAGTPDVPA